MTKIFTILTISTWLAFATGCASPPAPDAETLRRSLDAADRPAEDRARDDGRKPAEVVAFLGIRPGQTVVDLIAAGGYYSEVLSHVVGPSGTVYAQNSASGLQRRDGANEKAISARLAGGRLANIRRLNAELSDLGLAPDSVDAAIAALNFHDIYNRAGEAAAVGVLQAVMAVLVPGGVLGIVDHVGNPGADNKKLHRIEESLVVDAAVQAGFEVEAVGDMLRSPEDDRTKFVFAPGMRGHTDRFVLRLRKPSR